MVNKIRLLDEIKSSFCYIFNYLEEVEGFKFEECIRHFNIIQDLIGGFGIKYLDKIIELKNEFMKQDEMKNAKLYCDVLDFYYDFFSEINKEINKQMESELNVKR